MPIYPWQVITNELDARAVSTAGVLIVLMVIQLVTMARLARVTRDM